MNALALAGMPADRIAVLSDRPIAGKMFPVEIPGIGSLAANARMRELLTGTGQGSGGMRGALLGLGVSPQEIERCADEVRRGRTLEAIVVDDARAAEASAILTRYAAGAQDLEEAGEIVVPVIREDLQIGTREIDAGGVRIASHVREVPVEQTVTIREEKVTVERRIIDRPLGEGDDAFRDRAFDLKAYGEEPVVNKRARVVEEIRVHKDRNEHLAKVNDTLRHTDVKIVELPSQHTFDMSRYREHFLKTYGDRYDIKSVAPAYEFGERLSRTSGAGEWSKIESNARLAWEKANPGTWERFKEAIFVGWRRRAPS
jgi:uncharacterized protein (TIGR02271 family)